MRDSVVPVLFCCLLFSVCPFDHHLSHCSLHTCLANTVCCDYCHLLISKCSCRSI